MWHRLRAIIRWLGAHELAVLLGLLVVVVGTWAFVELAGEVMEGDTQAVDEMILRAMRRHEMRAAPLEREWVEALADNIQSAGEAAPLDREEIEAAVQKPVPTAVPVGPDWLPELVRDLTALGGYLVLIIVTAAVVGFLVLDRKYHVAAYVVAAVVSGYLITMGLKNWFERPRPALFPHLHDVGSASFPSGHSMMSAVVYLTLGTLLMALVKSRRLKFYFLSVALLLTVSVGMSRVYLGVHYPSDVLAGWAAGLAWSTACWLLARRLQRKGTIEKEA